ncbi:MAG: hypothetical protein M3Y18_09135, partial [Candidatus Eremiobacteraeota bacterium]|nr:hypothetical protein [Candidatus Eremiobacteraeota bacterium]
MKPLLFSIPNVTPRASERWHRAKFAQGLESAGFQENVQALELGFPQRFDREIGVFHPCLP